MKFAQLLIELDACEEAREWAANKTWPEVYTTCQRGDWLLWLFKKTNPEKIREFILAKGYCANVARNLMKDPRSIAAVDAAILFGHGRIGEDELSAAYAAAVAVTADSAAYISANPGIYASNADAYAAAAAAYAASSNAITAAEATIDAVANATAFAAAHTAGFIVASANENLRVAAEIIRKYFPIEMWGIETID